MHFPVEKSGLAGKKEEWPLLKGLSGGFKRLTQANKKLRGKEGAKANDKIVF